MEDIKNLEEIINLCKEEINNNDKNITATLDLEDLKSLINLLTGYKQLEEENKQLEAIKDEAIRRYNFESIPKSKLKEKIEELDKKRRKFTSDNVNNFYLQEFTRKYTQKSDHDYGVFSTPETITYCTNNELLGRIEALQELLES